MGVPFPRSLPSSTLFQTEKKTDIDCFVPHVDKWPILVVVSFCMLRAEVSYDMDNYDISIQHSCTPVEKKKR